MATDGVCPSARLCAANAFVPPPVPASSVVKPMVAAVSLVRFTEPAERIGAAVSGVLLCAKVAVIVITPLVASPAAIV